jgi:hypothetical protein
MASGGIYVFKDGREVPDTFNLLADYAAGHSLVLSSTMANSRHIPGLIRGHLGSIVMVQHGMFEAPTDFISVYPEHNVIDDAYKAKFGDSEIDIPVDQSDMMTRHIANFLSCMRTREKPVLDVETALRAQVTISMSVQSYQQGKVLFWDERAMKVRDHAVTAA